MGMADKDTSFVLWLVFCVNDSDFITLGSKVKKIPHSFISRMDAYQWSVRNNYECCFEGIGVIILKHKETGDKVFIASNHIELGEDLMKTVGSFYEADIQKFKIGQQHFKKVQTEDGTVYTYVKSFTKGDLLNGVTEDAPAINRPDGTKEWFDAGIRHRNNGPALYKPNGYLEYWFKGKLHNPNGPAVVNPEGRDEYWVHGLNQRDDDFDEWMESKRFRPRERERA